MEETTKFFQWSKWKVISSEMYRETKETPESITPPNQLSNPSNITFGSFSEATKAQVMVDLEMLEGTLQ